MQQAGGDIGRLTRRMDVTNSTKLNAVNVVCSTELHNLYDEYVDSKAVLERLWGFRKCQYFNDMSDLARLLLYESMVLSSMYK